MHTVTCSRIDLAHQRQTHDNTFILHHPRIRDAPAPGARWPHVVHVNSYHVGGFPPVINETMAKLYRHYMPDRAPIWTQLGIEALGLPTMRIEIRVTAIIA